MRSASRIIGLRMTPMPMPSILLPAPPRRILLIKPSALGDIVHALPVLNLLKRRWPEAHISWLVGSAFAGLLEGHPQLDEVIRFDRHRFASAWWNPRALGELIHFGRDLRRRHFDLVIDLQGLFRSGFTTGIARSPVRVGFANAREMAWMFYTHRVPVDSPDVHALDRYLRVAELLGCGRGPVEFVFSLSEEDRAAARRLTQDRGRYAVLIPGTNWPTKRWPVEYFASLVEPLKARFGLESVVAGSRAESDLAAQIPGALNVAGKTNLRELVALLDGADLVIANDSGPMHIAAALGRPLATMYGPTNPARTGPWNRDDSVVHVEIPCSPCYSRRCSHTSCMKWLTSSAVLDVAEQQLKAPANRAVPLDILQSRRRDGSIDTPASATIGGSSASH
jgi:heptosyltransferase-1